MNELKYRDCRSRVKTHRDEICKDKRKKERMKERKRMREKEGETTERHRKFADARGRYEGGVYTPRE